MEGGLSVKSQCFPTSRVKTLFQKIDLVLSRVTILIMSNSVTVCSVMLPILQII